jgi:hypothetical protein
MRFFIWVGIFNMMIVGSSGHANDVYTPTGQAVFNLGSADDGTVFGGFLSAAHQTRRVPAAAGRRGACCVSALILVCSVVRARWSDRRLMRPFRLKRGFSPIAHRQNTFAAVAPLGVNFANTNGESIPGALSPAGGERPPQEGPRVRGRRIL